jgi:hypothetical protein
MRDNAALEQKVRHAGVISDRIASEIRPASNLFGDATAPVTDCRWQAFNAAFCPALDNAESVIVT